MALPAGVSSGCCPATRACAIWRRTGSCGSTSWPSRLRRWRRRRASGTASPSGSGRRRRPCAKACSIGCGTASASGAAPACWPPRAAALAVYVALRPPDVGPEQIAALDQRLAGIEAKLADVDAAEREIGALDERLARIEGATQGLAETPGEIAALGDRLAGIESRLDATVPVLSHVAVLIDKYSRPMMTADLDVADGRLVLRLKIKPPRDFTGKTLEVWLVPPDGTPRSLGLLPSEKGGTTVALNLPHDIAEALATSELAVSLEPSGGSTTGLPTGPVLFSGAVVPVDL